MEIRRKNRLVIFLCILLVGQEFSRANPLLGQHDKLSSEQEDNFDDFLEDYEPDNQDSGYAYNSYSKRMNLVHQKPAVESGGKRGWVTTLFKGVKMVTTITEIGATVGVLATNIFAAVDKCRTTEPKAAEFHQKYIDEYAKVKELGEQADNLQFEAEQDQSFVESTTEMFRNILVMLNKINGEAKHLLSISPIVRETACNATQAIERIIDEKNNKEGIEYIEIDNLYRSKLQNALGIAIPAFMLAVPAGIALFKAARKKTREVDIGDVATKKGITFKLPSKVSNLFKKTRFGRWVGRIKTSATKGIRNLKTRFNNRFSSIGRIAGRFKVALTSALRIAGSAYALYESIAGMINQCREIRETAEKAYKEAKKAVDEIRGSLDDIQEHRDEMRKVLGIIRGNLTGEDFLESVKETQITMENASNKSEPMLAVARGIQHFRDIIGTSDDLVETYNATSDLHDQLKQVPFAYMCYSNMVLTLNNVNRFCKSGDAPIEELIASQRDRIAAEIPEGNPESIKRCKDDRGIDYVSDADIKKSWMGFAKLNNLHPLCLMNRKEIRETICNEHRADDNKSIADIAAIYEKIGVDENDVKAVIDVLPPGLTSHYQNMACNLRRGKKTDQEISESFMKFFSKDVPVEQIAQVDCENIRCVQYETAVEKAWEENQITVPEFTDDD